jgi:hypothetical protein
MPNYSDYHDELHAYCYIYNAINVLFLQMLQCKNALVKNYTVLTQSKTPCELQSFTFIFNLYYYCLPLQLCCFICDKLKFLLGYSSKFALFTQFFFDDGGICSLLQ